MLKASQISAIINEVYDGVERSKCGKMRVEMEGKKEFDPLAYNTYINILNNIFPKNLGMNVKGDVC